MTVESQTWTASSSQVDAEVSGAEVWWRFWLGVGCVGLFLIATIVLAAVLGGTKAAAAYGLLGLLVALLAAMVDGIVLFRRRSR